MTSTARLLASASYLLITAGWFWCLYHGGGILPSQRMVGIGTIALGAGLAFVEAGRGRSALKLPSHIVWSFGFVVAIAGMQLVPLPFWLVEVLSPHRAALAHLVIETPEIASVDLKRWCALSLAPANTWLELTSLAGCVLMFLAIRDLCRSGLVSRWWFLTSILLASMSEALAGLQQAFHVDGSATATGTFLNRNHLAGFLEMALPFAVANSWHFLALRSEPKIRRVGLGLLLGICALMLLSATLFTYSRTGAACALVALLLSVGLSAWPYVRSSRGRLWTVIASCALLAMCVVLLAPRRLRDRLEHASVFDQESTSLRLEFWRDCRPLLRDYLLVGTGLGSFESVFPRYQQSGARYRIEYAHNDYLQALIELGLPAFALGIICFGGFVILLGRQSIRQVGSSAGFWSLASFSSLLAISLHSFTDFNLRVPANAMTIAWVLALGTIGQRPAVSSAATD